MCYGWFQSGSSFAVGWNYDCILKGQTLWNYSSVSVCLWSIAFNFESLKIKEFNGAQAGSEGNENDWGQRNAAWEAIKGDEAILVREEDNEVGPHAWNHQRNRPRRAWRYFPNRWQRQRREAAVQPQKRGKVLPRSLLTGVFQAPWQRRGFRYTKADLRTAVQLQFSRISTGTATELKLELNCNWTGLLFWNQPTAPARASHVLCWISTKDEGFLAMQ